MILILDFGGQYTQLIARRVREFQVYCEIHPFDVSPEVVRRLDPEGVILSGGPASVYDTDAPQPHPGVLELLTSGSPPVLGICYGMGILNRAFGGEVARSERKEFGPADIRVVRMDPFFALGGRSTRVWMSHGDRMASIPREMETLAMLRNFVLRVANARTDWTMESFVEQEVPRLRARVGDKRVVCALSGGVDSTVTAALVQQAVGDRLTCIFVDNGLLRAGEVEEVVGIFRDRMQLDVRLVDAAARFLENLRGVADPERKRRIIGTTFIEVFEQEAKTIPHATFLAQGTLYPDVIESISVRGPSATIKSHHNVGGLPERMQLELLEPLRELFKDEVRRLGRVLGLPDTIITRQPFPGPGLAIRVIGPVDAERLRIVRGADAIVQDEIRRAELYQSLWQAFAVLLPVKTVGVMGDERTYENVLAIRAVQSSDGLTADWARLPDDLLGRLSTRIINEVAGVNRVVYDISSKPPATIEWE
ncbi:MAG: glutamine-hydrolyzing GMP synthase [Deltaproteobacteria bacterium]|nr:MAG: glutamine-hydrolyzing GMP synthase [Deltaproteobacteria bacterium]